MFSIKRLMSIMLALFMLVFSVSPSSANAATPPPSSQKAVVYNSEVGNQVVEVTQESKKVYVIVSAPVDIEKSIEKANLTSSDGSDQDKFGQRYYFQFADSLSEAKSVADTKVTSSANNLTAASTFWHGSFVDSWWSLLNGDGFHAYLAPVDANYITNVGWAGGDALVGALAVLGILTAPEAVVLGCIVTVAILTVSWACQNNDGSIDIYSPNYNRYDNRTVSGGQSLGTAKDGHGNWFNFFWPSYGPTISR